MKLNLRGNSMCESECFLFICFTDKKLSFSLHFPLFCFAFYKIRLSLAHFYEIKSIFVLIIEHFADGDFLQNILAHFSPGFELNFLHKNQCPSRTFCELISAIISLTKCRQNIDGAQPHRVDEFLMVRDLKGFDKFLMMPCTTSKGLTNF